MDIRCDDGQVITEVEPVMYKGNAGYSVHGDVDEGFYPAACVVEVIREYPESELSRVIDDIERIVENLVRLLDYEREKVDYLATMLAAYDKKHIGIERADQREVWKDAAAIAVTSGWSPAEGE